MICLLVDWDFVCLGLHTSFAATGLLDEVKKSRKYVSMYKQIEQLQQMAQELGGSSD